MSNNEIVQGFDDEQDENLNIALEKVDTVEGCLIVYLTGSIDTYNISFFQKQVVKTIESGYARLIFHCRGLTYISSTGINSFSPFLKLVKDRGGAMVFFAIQPHIQEVFQVLGFAQVFTIKESIDAALGLFASEPSILPFSRFLICPVCSCRVQVFKEGHFRCSQCKTALAIDNRGQVFLG